MKEPSKQVLRLVRKIKQDIREWNYKSQCLSENFKLCMDIRALEGRINDLHTEFNFQIKMLIVVVVLIFSMLMIGDNIFTNRIKKMENQIQNMKTTSVEVKPVDSREKK